MTRHQKLIKNVEEAKGDPQLRDDRWVWVTTVTTRRKQRCPKKQVETRTPRNYESERPQTAQAIAEIAVALKRK